VLVGKTGPKTPAQKTAPHKPEKGAMFMMEWGTGRPDLPDGARRHEAAGAHRPRERLAT
jgi:hypothetical protein